MNSSSSLLRERERENENENEHTAIFRIGRKTTFQQRNAIKSLPLTLKTPIIIVLQQSVGVFFISRSKVMHKTTTKKLVPSKRKSRTSEGEDKLSKKEEEKNAKRRSVGSFSRFSDVFATLFSPLLSSRPSRLLVVFSLLEQSASPISHPIVFLARFALLGFQTREREKEKE